MKPLAFSDELKENLRFARKVAVLTGAGISSESGVPTFRGEGGLWKKHKPEELANFDAFLANPKLIWEWYQFRRKNIEKIKPNPGHYTLAEMEKHYPHFTLITQNVDGLHHRAGSKNICELHGNINRNKCLSCGKLINDSDALQIQSLPPRCECGGQVRPDVVWFGEMLPPDVLAAAVEHTKQADVFCVIGTSAVVYPAAMLPGLAIEYGAFVIEINPESTPISHLVDVTIRGKSGEVLPQLWDDVQKNKPF